MVWNEKYHNFCQRQNMWNATINAACFIYKHCNPNESTVIEFKKEKFQRHMKLTKGQEYHRTYVPKIIRQLEERSNGLVIVQENYGKGVYKLLVHPLSFLTENKKPKRESCHDENARNCMFSEQRKEEEFKQQQQFISKVDELLKKIGLDYDQDALNRIWRLSGKSISRVVEAIEFLLHRNSSNKISKPHGFIIECLKKRWCDGFDIYYEPELPTFKFKSEIRNFVDSICTSVEISSGKIRRGSKGSSQKKYVPRGTN